MNVEPESWAKERPGRIRRRLFELQERGALTSRGEAISWASIGRVLDPPVSRQMVMLVRDGRAVSERVRRAIEAELGEAYWVSAHGENVSRKGANPASPMRAMPRQGAQRG